MKKKLFFYKSSFIFIFIYFRSILNLTRSHLYGGFFWILSCCSTRGKIWNVLYLLSSLHLRIEVHFFLYTWSCWSVGKASEVEDKRRMYLWRYCILCPRCVFKPLQQCLCFCSILFFEMSLKGRIILNNNCYINKSFLIRYLLRKKTT